MTTDKELLRTWLTKQRLQNYGYDYRDFRRMSALKSRMKTKLINTPDADIRKALAKEGILGSGRRLNRSKNKKSWEYTTGQSFNEEMLNMMVLGATKGKKSFFQMQNNWEFH